MPFSCGIFICAIWYLLVFLDIAATQVDGFRMASHAAGALFVHTIAATQWRNTIVCQKVAETDESYGAKAPLASSKRHHVPAWEFSHTSVRTLTDAVIGLRCMWRTQDCLAPEPLKLLPGQALARFVAGTTVPNEILLCLADDNSI